MSNFENVMKQGTEEQNSPTAEKKPFAEVMKERRDRCSQLSAKAYSEITTDKAKFVGMLEVAGYFLRNSIGNIMLISAQNQKATQMKTFEEWKEDGKSVKKGASAVWILKKKEYTAADGKIRNGYDPIAYFDVCDTVDGKAPDAPKFEDKTLVKALVHGCSARVIVDADYPENKIEGAYYDKAKNEIRCRYGMSMDELVPSLAKSAALAQLCGGDEEAKPEQYEFKARAVAYLLTKKYGIDTKHIQIQSIPSEYEFIEPDEFKAEVAEILTTAKNIDGRVCEVLFRPREQSKSNDTKSNDSKADDKGKADAEPQKTEPVKENKEER